VPRGLGTYKEETDDYGGGWQPSERRAAPISLADLANGWKPGVVVSIARLDRRIQPFSG